MNRIYLFLIILFVSMYKARAQDKSPVEDTIIYSVVDTLPTFPEGKDAMYRFIYSRFDYQKLSDNDVQGRIFIEFVVEKDGILSNFKITRSLDPFCDKEAIRILKQMPKWKPGKLKHKKVRTKIEIPISIKLE